MSRRDIHNFIPRTRRRCSRCGKRRAVGPIIPDRVWSRVPIKYRKGVLCADCMAVYLSRRLVEEFRSYWRGHRDGFEGWLREGPVTGKISGKYGLMQVKAYVPLIEPVIKK